MNVASTWSADEVRVRLYFLVKVLKARGRNVAGGSMIGSTLALVGAAAALKGLIGCTGVAKAGEEEGIRFGGAGVAGALNIGAALGFG